MLRTRMICLLTAIACLLGIGVGAVALEVDCGSTHCFSPEDFSQEELAGICITGLPDAQVGTAMLGHRVLQPGDILTADQLSKMTFVALQTQVNQEAIMTYLPIYENRVAPVANMTIAVLGREDKSPVAEDFALETYKNLPNEGKLKVSDPEGQALTYTLTRQPKRGQVELKEDGTFIYTPKKNKVGVDSFVFTATDPAGNVSREATVTIRILKPTDATQYQDTIGTPYRFAAEWMKNTGLFIGERIGDAHCFRGDETMSRGEFLAMAVKLLNIPMEDTTTLTKYTEEAPVWLRPYLAAALRAGLTAGLPLTESGAFGAEVPVTGAEAAVMLQNAMDLGITTVVSEEETDVPAWAVNAVTAMQDNGIEVFAGKNLTRGQAAQLLYQISQKAAEAPGLQMYQ